MTRTASQCGAQRLGRCRRLVVVGHPAGARGATVEALTGVGGPHRAGTDVELPPPPAGVVDGDDHRVGPGHAGAVEQGVDDGLVLERHPLGAAVGDERSAGERRRLAEEDAERHGRAIGVELLDGIDQDGRRVGHHRQRGMQLSHVVRAPADVGGDDPAVRLRPGAEPLCRRHQHVGGAELTKHGDHRRPPGRRAAGQDHPPAADQVAEWASPPVHLQRCQTFRAAIGTDSRTGSSSEPDHGERTTMRSSVISRTA